MVPTIIVMTIVEDINMLKKGESHVRRYHKIFNDFEMKDYRVYDQTVDKKLP